MVCNEAETKFVFFTRFGPSSPLLPCSHVLQTFNSLCMHCTAKKDHHPIGYAFNGPHAYEYICMQCYIHKYVDLSVHCRTDTPQYTSSFVFSSVAISCRLVCCLVRRLSDCTMPTARATTLTLMGMR